MEHKKYITEKGTIHYWVNISTPENKWIVFLPGLTADHKGISICPIFVLGI